LPDVIARRPALSKLINPLALLVVVAGSSVTGAERNKSEPTTLFPKALAPGDTVMIVAPAKYLSKARVDLAT
jgi:hypothetical protein